MNHLTAQHIIQSRAGGASERCHGIRHLGSYNNAAHSWGVAMLMWHIWPEHFQRLSIYCITHDVPEAWSGDIPAPTMRYLPGLKGSLEHFDSALSRGCGCPPESDLTGDDYAMLKACDRLEFWLWCREQAALGNMFAGEGQREIERYFTEVPLPSKAQEVYEALCARTVVPVQAGIMKDIADEQAKAKAMAERKLDLVLRGPTGGIDLTKSQDRASREQDARLNKVR